ncbi:hypothetical protein [Streptomyces sp. NPDC001450]
MRRHCPPHPPRELPVPGHRELLVVTAVIAVATFAVRLCYPLHE